MSQVFFYGDPQNRKSDQKIFLATPAYNDVSGGYAYSMLALGSELQNKGIEFCAEIYTGNCHVDDSRNRLVRDFLETDCTDLIFLDSDMRFNSTDLLRLIKFNRDVVGGTYPLKQDVESYPIRHLAGKEDLTEDGLYEVEGAPTGFLRIRRDVLQMLSVISSKFPASDDWKDRLQIPLIFERLYQNGTRWGGDYAFCLKWRAIGGRVFIDPCGRFEHFGEFVWRGSYRSYLERASGRAMEYELSAIRNRAETPEDLIEMVEMYGNQSCSAGVEFLTACIHFARDLSGPILECGSGLSTFALAAANPQAEIWSIESDPAWCSAIQVKIDRLGLKNVRIIYAPIKKFDGFDWYDVDVSKFPEFNLVVCDGPPRLTSGGRAGICFLGFKLKENAVLLFDDYDNSMDEIVSYWGGPIHIKGAIKPFAITTFNRADKPTVNPNKP